MLLKAVDAYGANAEPPEDRPRSCVRGPVIALDACGGHEYRESDDWYKYPGGNAMAELQSSQKSKSRDTHHLCHPNEDHSIKQYFSS